MTYEEALKYLDEHCTASAIPLEVKAVVSKALERQKPREFYADENRELCKFDGTGTTTVYEGFVDDLKKVELEWRTIGVDDVGEAFEVLTLKEIAEQCTKKGIYIITVFREGMLGGEIFQYGNYLDGKWVNYGDTIGGA